MPQPSPYMTPEIKKLAEERSRTGMQEKALSDLLAIHDRFLERLGEHQVSVQEVKDYAKTIVDHAERILNLPKGEKGDQGDRGDDGDSVDFEKVVAAVLARMPEVKHGKDADPDIIATRVITRLTKGQKDSKESVIDMPAIISAVIGHLKDKKVLSKEHIGGLEEEISSYRNQLAGKHYGDDTWARGGGDTVEAGSGVTITSNAAGRKVISAVGTAPVALTPTGTVNGVNATFGVLSQPSSVISDGITYFEGAGYSYLAGNITMDVPPSQYIRYYA